TITSNKNGSIGLVHSHPIVTPSSYAHRRNAPVEPCFPDEASAIYSLNDSLLYAQIFPADSKSPYCSGLWRPALRSRVPERLTVCPGIRRRQAATSPSRY